MKATRIIILSMTTATKISRSEVLPSYKDL